MTVDPKADSTEKPKKKDDAVLESSDLPLPDDGAALELEGDGDTVASADSSPEEQEPESVDTLDEEIGFYDEDLLDASSEVGEKNAEDTHENESVEESGTAPVADDESIELMGEGEAAEADASSKSPSEVEEKDDVVDVSENEVSSEQESKAVEQPEYSDIFDESNDVTVKDDAKETPENETSSEQESKAVEQPEYPDIFDDSNDEAAQDEGQLDEALTEDDKAAELKSDAGEAEREPSGDSDEPPAIEPSVSKKTAEDLSGETQAKSKASRSSGESRPASATASPPKSRVAIVLGLLAIIGAGGAMWMSIDMAERVAKLEAQPVAAVPVVGMSDQREEIEAISKRVDELSEMFSMHMKQVAQMPMAEPGTETMEPLLAEVSDGLVSVSAVEMAGEVAATGEMAGEMALTDEMAGEMAPTDEMAGEMAPADEMAGEMAPTDEMAGEMAPADEMAGEMAPADEMASEMAPTDEVASEMAPTDEVDASNEVPSAADGNVPWMINLSSHSSRTGAENEVERLKSLGVDSEWIKAEVNGAIWYRVRVDGGANVGSSQKKLKILQENIGILDAWIGPR